MKILLDQYNLGRRRAGRLPGDRGRDAAAGPADDPALRDLPEVLHPRASRRRDARASAWRPWMRRRRRRRRRRSSRVARARARHRRHEARRRRRRPDGGVHGVRRRADRAERGPDDRCSPACSSSAGRPSPSRRRWARSTRSASACGGPLDSTNGVLLAPLHLPGWRTCRSSRSRGGVRAAGRARQRRDRGGGRRAPLRRGSRARATWSI